MRLTQTSCLAASELRLPPDDCISDLDPSDVSPGVRGDSGEIPAFLVWVDCFCQEGVFPESLPLPTCCVAGGGGVGVRGRWTSPTWWGVMGGAGRDQEREAAPDS